MYFHLGEDVLVKTKDLIGIFDLEKTSTSKKTKEFLVNATKKNSVVTVSYEMPRSFVITCKKNRVCNKHHKKKEATIFISQISAASLYKRSKRGKRRKRKMKNKQIKIKQEVI